MLAGVADGLTVCDWLGDRLGLGEVLVGADVGAVEERDLVPEARFQRTVLDDSRVSREVTGAPI